MTIPSLTKSIMGESKTLYGDGKIQVSRIDDTKEVRYGVPFYLEPLKLKDTPESAREEISKLAGKIVAVQLKTSKRENYLLGVVEPSKTDELFSLKPLRADGRLMSPIEYPYWLLKQILTTRSGLASSLQSELLFGIPMSPEEQAEIRAEVDHSSST